MSNGVSESLFFLFLINIIDNFKIIITTMYSVIILHKWNEYNVIKDGTVITR